MTFNFLFRPCNPHYTYGDTVGTGHRGRTYIESDRMTSSAPMESADQTAWAGFRASTTMVVLTRPPPVQSDQLTPQAPMTSSCRSLCMSFLDGTGPNWFGLVTQEKRDRFFSLPNRAPCFACDTRDTPAWKDQSLTHICARVHREKSSRSPRGIKGTQT